MDVSVITTLYNERESVEELIGSLLAQTMPPAEIVVVDAGSSDGTFEVLERLAESHPQLRVIDQPGDRTVGRNTAVAATASVYVACIDGGCVAEPDWLEHLASALEEGADWAAGFYRPEGRTLLSSCIGLVMVYVLEEVDPDTFLPSARSLAFHKDAWERVGGFPHAPVAEDTAFGEALLAAGYRPRFVSKALVQWRPPESLTVLWVTVYRWGRGDGLAGMRNYVLKRLLWLYAGTAVGAVLTSVLAPRLLPLVLAPLALNVLRSTRLKYRWAKGRAKYCYIPVAHLVANAAQVTGFVVGALRAKLGWGEQAAWRAS